ncbi:MAG: iron chaperone [Clostridiales bacterium]|nr:iron chaperone [Clostridiales bacterium]
MKVFSNYLTDIDDLKQRDITEGVLNWVNTKYPDLVPKIAWNQPMFTDHGTFIIAFSIARNHLAVSPEKKGITHFSNDITQAGYEYSKHLIRFPWNKPIDYLLLEKIIEFNILDKADSLTFWRK